VINYYKYIQNINDIILPILLLLDSQDFVLGCQKYKYIYLLNPNGHPPEETCETLGYNNVADVAECYAEYKGIPELANFGIFDGILEGGAIRCIPHNPNYCFMETNEKHVVFTEANCPLHSDKSHSTEGMICKWCTLISGTKIEILLP
jgi:hypothetical protein